MDLNAVIQDSRSQVDVRVLVDANQVYEDSIANLKIRKPVEQRARGSTTGKEQAALNNYYASVRTNVSWCVCCTRRNLRNQTLQILLVCAFLFASTLAGGRVSGTSTSSDFTVPKAYLVFVLVLVSLTGIGVSSRFQIPFTGLTNFVNWQLSLSTLYLVIRMFTG